MQKNEVELCEIIVRMLEKENDAARANVTFPERDGTGPPVELRFNLGARRFAIEHTLLEPFPMAIRIGKEFAELTSEIVAELDGKMPVPGTYHLQFPVHPTAGRHRRTHAELRKEIVAWVWSAAREMHAELPERCARNRLPLGYDEIRCANIQGLSLTLRRRVHWSEIGRHDGSLFLHRVVGESIEGLRRVRIATALDSKLPKLAACADAGDLTILILEYSDIALTNQIAIAEALEVLLEDRDDRPDYIFIADTTLSDAWQFFEPMVAGVFSMNMPFIGVTRCQVET